MSAPARRRRRRTPLGLTLVELAVGLGVSALTIAAAMTLLAQQRRALEVGGEDRAIQESGRVALQVIVSKLRTAGYGVDSNLIFDFGATPVVPRTNLIEPAVQVATPGYRCGAATRCRDSVTGPDEIVFHTRNPLFSRPLVSSTATSLTLRGELKKAFHLGQLLQVSCMQGTRVRAYVTVGGETPAALDPSNPDVTADVPVALLAGATSATGLPLFGRENATLADGCFAAGAVVTAVDRYRFYVATYDPDGTTPGVTAEARPYLMLDQGLTSATTPTAPAAPILLPLAPDVEDLQFTYLFPPSAAGGPARVVGATAGTNIADQAGFAMDATVAPPAYGDAPDAPVRATGSPANIDAVRVSVVIRSPSTDITRVSTLDRTIPAAGNRPNVVGPANHLRALFETTVVVRNASSQSFVYPFADATAAAPSNRGGG
jgi:hypothetical protein